MFNVVATMDFNYGDFSKCKNIIRKNKDEKDKFFEGDKFSITKEMYEYLTGGNSKGLVLVKLIGIDKIETKPVIETVKKTIVKSTNKKNINKK